jgi:hypothetical protein
MRARPEFTLLPHRRHPHQRPAAPVALRRGGPGQPHPGQQPGHPRLPGHRQPPGVVADARLCHLRRQLNHRQRHLHQPAQHQATRTLHPEAADTTGSGRPAAAVDGCGLSVCPPAARPSPTRPEPLWVRAELAPTMAILDISMASSVPPLLQVTACDHLITDNGYRPTTSQRGCAAWPSIRRPTDPSDPARQSQQVCPHQNASS